MDANLRREDAGEPRTCEGPADEGARLGVVARVQRFGYRWKRAILGAWYDINRNHTLAIAAGLSYYFLLSMFPLLIMLAAALAYVPIPNLFDQILEMMARVVPPESMALVREIVATVVTTKRGDIFSLGLLGTVWIASGGFAAMIEALNVAYDVHEGRSLIRTRLLAIGLTMLIGSLAVVALTVMVLGPQFGEWLSAKIHVDPVFVAVWPYLRWGIILTFTVLAVEVLYFLAPNVKQRFKCTLAGAVFAVGMWLAASYLFTLYVQNFGSYNKTYGTLGAVVALLFWLYLSAIAILSGAEINAELLKAAGERLPKKEQVDPEEIKDPRAELPLDEEAEQKRKEAAEEAA